MPATIPDLSSMTERQQIAYLLRATAADASAGAIVGAGQRHTRSVLAPSNGQHSNVVRERTTTVRKQTIPVELLPLEPGRAYPNPSDGVALRMVSAEEGFVRKAL